MSLHGESLTVKAGGRAILDGASLTLTSGEFVAIVGPNGAGKSTLLRTMAGDISSASGRVTMNARSLGAWSGDELSLQRAVLPQNPSIAFPFRVWDVVELGRYPHRGRASLAEHHAAIAGALEAADVTSFAMRDCRTLSGGELHRTHFARVLAQLWTALPDGRVRYLLLDEPTAALDLFHQQTVLARAQVMSRAGAGVLTILHDLNLAAAFADRVVVMHKGRIVADGAPDAVLTEPLIEEVWGVPCRVIPRSGDQAMIVVVGAKKIERRAALRAAE